MNNIQWIMIELILLGILPGCITSCYQRYNFSGITNKKNLPNQMTALANKFN